MSQIKQKSNCVKLDKEKKILLLVVVEKNKVKPRSPKCLIFNKVH